MFTPPGFGPVLIDSPFFPLQKSALPDATTIAGHSQEFISSSQRKIFFIGGGLLVCFWQPKDVYKLCGELLTNGQREWAVWVFDAVCTSLGAGKLPVDSLSYSPLKEASLNLKDLNNYQLIVLTVLNCSKESMCPGLLCPFP